MCQLVYKGSEVSFTKETFTFYWSHNYVLNLHINIKSLMLIWDLLPASLSVIVQTCHQLHKRIAYTCLAAFAAGWDYRSYWTNAATAAHQSEFLTEKTMEHSSCVTLVRLMWMRKLLLWVWIPDIWEMSVTTIPFAWHIMKRTFLKSIKLTETDG